MRIGWRQGGEPRRGGEPSRGGESGQQLPRSQPGPRTVPREMGSVTQAGVVEVPQGHAEVCSPLAACTLPGCTSICTLTSLRSPKDHVCPLPVFPTHSGSSELKVHLRISHSWSRSKGDGKTFLAVLTVTIGVPRHVVCPRLSTD